MQPSPTNLLRENGSGADRPSKAWMGWLLPVGFGVLALGLSAWSRQTEIPVPPPSGVDRASLVVGPKRVAMTDPARLLVEGVQQSCQGCHQIFQSASAGGAELHYHKDFVLSHGMNNRCVNCHDATDRERLTLRNGKTVPFNQTPVLCAQCHGTVYRDWERGTHGKTLGSWVMRSEAQRRLSCNECHDPHSPKYEAYSPLPAPNTLRMGDQSTPQHQQHTGRVSPLQRWLYNSSTDHGGGKPHDGEHP